LWEAEGRDFKSGPQQTFNPGMKFASFYNLKFTKVYINLENMLFDTWTLLQICLFLFYTGGGGREGHETF
jgi:hypothetical protein